MSRVELKGVNEDRLGDAGINNKILFGRLADAHSEQQTEKEVAPLIVARGDVQVKCRSLILQGGYACCALAFFLFFFFALLLCKVRMRLLTSKWRCKGTAPPPSILSSSPFLFLGW